MICICGCSQKKAVRPRYRRLEEDKIDSREIDKQLQAADVGTQHKSGSQYSVDSANDLSAESELKRSKKNR